MRLTVAICIMFVILSVLLMGGKVVDRTVSSTQEISIVQMQKEIMRMWNLWYENQDEWTRNKLKENKRNWPILAGELAKVVKRYQYTPVKIHEWSDRTTTLPIGKDAHLMAGMMAIFETKVRNEMIGQLGEIGILQCHPKWCLVRNSELGNLPMKERKRTARENPSLNLDAAVQHLTVSYGICNKKVRDTNDWAYSVAHYGAGTLALENGRCVKRKFAKIRVNEMKSYRRKIKKSIQNI